MGGHTSFISSITEAVKDIFSFCLLYYIMDVDAFGFGDAVSSDSSDMGQTQDDLDSLPSNITHQSHAFTTITSKVDDKTTIPDSITEAEDVGQNFNRNRVLRELYDYLYPA